MGTPRIAAEDYISEDDIRPGMWVRAPWYKGEGHVVSAGDVTMFKCGRPVPREEVRLQVLRQLRLEEVIEKSPWYLAIDQRKGSKCSYCKSKKTVDYTVRPGQPEPQEERPASRAPSGVKAQWRHRRFLQHVEYIRHLFGGTYLEEGNHG